MNLSPEVEAYLGKAHHALEVAGKLQAGGELADAAGKAYYAMFYAAQALLRAHGIEVVKHSAVATMLGRHFAKTGRLDSKFPGCSSTPVESGRLPITAFLKRL